MTSFTEQIQAQFTNVVRSREDLHEYQDGLAIPFIKANPFAGLFMGLGLGKTVSTGTAIADLIMDGEVNRVLVIGPIRVITVGWPDDLSLWQQTAWLTNTVIRLTGDEPELKEAVRAARARARAAGVGPADIALAESEALSQTKDRLLTALANKPTWISLINREAVPWLVTKFGRDWPWDMVVIDESSGFADHKSERVKAMLWARRTGKIKRMLELTATPTTEGYMKLFAQINLLDDGARFTDSITKYRETFFSYDRYKQKYNLQVGGEDRILEKIADITLVMKSKDYLDEQEPIVQSVGIRLSAKQMAGYRTMEKERVLELDSGREIEAKTAADLSSKLLQIASGVLYEAVETEQDNGDFVTKNVVHKLHDHKIQELERMFEALDGEPVLVAYHFQSSLDRILKAFPKAVKLDKEGKLIAKWNKRQIPIMLVHPQSAAHGLNLQHGGHNLILFDIPWSLELYLQLIGRLARQGQTKQVMVYLLTALGTLDEFVVTRLREKRDVQEDMFARLKRLIRKYQLGQKAKTDAEIIELAESM